MVSLVTGASGLVGSQVVAELLGRGKPVRALVRGLDKAAGLQEKGVQVVAGDIRDPATLAAALDDVDVVYHCAAAVGPLFSKKEIYDTNLTGVRNLLEAARRHKNVRVVLVSSVNVLGTRNLDPATEDLPYRRSKDPAADVKIDAERLALDYGRQGLDVTIVRPGFIYGPGDKHNLPRLVGAITRGKFRFLGSRDNVVPIVHVQDVAQALLLAGTNAVSRGRVYNITDGSRTTIGELADYLAGLVGCPKPERVLPYFVPYLACVMFDWLGKVRRPRKPAPITRAALRFLGTSRYVDIGRAQHELGFEPRVSFRDGMAATLEWIKNHLAEADHDSHSGNGKPA
jgi:nucleoside-diphosphate-sugar epimerase